MLGEIGHGIENCTLDNIKSLTSHKKIKITINVTTGNISIKSFEQDCIKRQEYGASVYNMVGGGCDN